MRRLRTSAPSQTAPSAIPSGSRAPVPSHTPRQQRHPSRDAPSGTGADAADRRSKTQPSAADARGILTSVGKRRKTPVRLQEPPSCARHHIPNAWSPTSGCSQTRRHAPLGSIHAPRPSGSERHALNIPNRPRPETSRSRSSAEPEHTSLPTGSSGPTAQATPPPVATPGSPVSALRQCPPTSPPRAPVSSVPSPISSPDASDLACMPPAVHVVQGQSSPSARSS
jgi:hypothetical protein